MDELTQIESRLSASFDAQEKINTVLHYIRQIAHKDTQPYNNLYDDNGNRIAYQVGKTYTLKTLIGTGNYLLNSNGWLQFHYYSSGTTVSAKYVKYTVS